MIEVDSLNGERLQSFGDDWVMNGPDHSSETQPQLKSVTNHLQYTFDNWFESFRETLKSSDHQNQMSIDPSSHWRNILIPNQEEPDAHQNQPQRRPDATVINEKALIDYLSQEDSGDSPSASNNSRSFPLDSPTPTISVLPRLDPMRRSSFGPLMTNSRWIGKQRSGQKSYDVQVQIVHLDLDSGSGSGLLNISGLTDELPTMVTFFDIEIIGPRYNFLTGAWGSTEQVDCEHWSKFPHFNRYLDHRQSTGIERVDFKDSANRRNILTNSAVQNSKDQKEWWSDQPFLFMRWKEKFLVGDYTSKDTNGASFAGFYYVCIELPVAGLEPALKIANSSKFGLPRAPAGKPSLCSPSRSASSHSPSSSTSSSRSDSYASIVRRSSSAGTSPESSPSVRLGGGRRSSRVPSSTFSSPDVSVIESSIHSDDRDELPSSSGSREFSIEPRASFDQSRGRRLMRTQTIHIEEEKNQPSDEDGNRSSDEKLFEHQRSPSSSYDCGRVDFGRRSSNSTDQFTKNHSLMTSHTTKDPIEFSEGFGLKWPETIIKGFYYHTESEPFQELILRPENPQNSSPSSSKPMDNDPRRFLKKDDVEGEFFGVLRGGNDGGGRDLIGGVVVERSEFDDEFDEDEDEEDEEEINEGSRIGHLFGTYQIC